MILLTGCTGYIGSQLAYALKKSKLNFIGIDNLKYSYKENFPYKNIFFKFDISSNKIEKLIKKKNIKTVIHCAALAYVLDAEKNKKKYDFNNVVKTKKFIDICKKKGVENFIFFSSSNVYKDTKKIFSENAIIEPKNTYGKNKVLIEKYLYKKKFTSYICLRLFNIIGMESKFKIFKPKQKYQRFFFKLINKKYRPVIKFYLKNKKVEYPKRDFLDIKDLNLLILKIIDKLNKKKIKSTFNVGSGKEQSILEIYEKFSKKIKIKKPIYKVLSKKELLKTKANNLKVRKYFSWRPKIKLIRSIQSTIKYAKI